MHAGVHTHLIVLPLDLFLFHTHTYTHTHTRMHTHTHTHTHTIMYLDDHDLDTQDAREEKRSHCQHLIWFRSNGISHVGCILCNKGNPTNNTYSLAPRLHAPCFSVFIHTCKLIPMLILASSPDSTLLFSVQR